MKEPNYKIWGKFDGKSTDEKKIIHPALFHMLDAGFVAQKLLETFLSQEKQILAESLNVDLKELSQVIGFFVAIHDMGKITPSFCNQIKAADNPWMAHELKEEKFRFYTEPGTHEWRHEVFSLYLINRLFPNVSCRDDIGAILGGHHGMYSALPLKVNRSEYRRFEKHSGTRDRNWREQQQIAFSILRSTFPLSSSTIKKIRLSADFYFFYSGLLTQVDWIASDENIFTFAGSNITWREYIKTIPAKLDKIEDKIKWKLCDIKNLDFEQMFPFQPNNNQKIIIQDVESLKAPSLLIIEDATGSGKTESAFYAATKLMINAGHRGMHVMMPTQATSNAMFKRIINYLEIVSEGRANLQLSHGNSSMNKEYMALKPKNLSEDDAVVSETWYTTDKVKFLAQFGGGTIDQGLMGVLPIKHFFLRLYGLANKVIILDEVHAYDMYMMVLVLRLIKELKRLGCSVIILSATLPNQIKQALAEAYGCKPPTEQIGYPRVTVASEGRAVVKRLNADSKKVKINHVYINPPKKYNGLEISNYQDLANHTLSKMNNCAAVICNTVRQSQEVFDVFSKVMPDVELIHARFLEGEKSQKAENILKRFGPESIKNGTRPHKAIVIATQILEQSFNIDFDFMALFLCPIDLLIQRLGRLHRFQSDRKSPAEASIIYEFKENENMNGYVYESFLTNMTWKNIHDLEHIITPNMTDDLISKVYVESEEGLDAEDWSAYRKFKKDRHNSVQKATNWVLYNDNSLVIHPDLAPLKIIEDCILSASGADEEIAGPKTRDITLATKVIVVFQKNKLWYFDPNGKIRCPDFRRTEYTPEEIHTILKNSCPIVGEPLFSYFCGGQKSWEKVGPLRHYSLLVLEQGVKIISSDKWTATLSYTSEAGLRTKIVSKF